MESESKNKKDLLLYLLEKGDAMVCLDARREDVDVPKNHKGNASLSLILNLNFRRPLDILDDAIYATLAFQGRPYQCVIPFDAVWAIFVPSFQEGQVWEASIPDDVQFDPKLAAAAAAGKSQKPPQTLKAVPAPKEEKEEIIESLGDESLEETTVESMKEPTAIKSASAKRDRSHLRVIK
jgi:stringent starvation protein B